LEWRQKTGCHFEVILEEYQNVPRTSKSLIRHVLGIP